MTSLQTISASISTSYDTAKVNVGKFCTAAKVSAKANWADNNTGTKVAMIAIAIISLGAGVASFLSGAGVISLAGLFAIHLTSAAFCAIGSGFTLGAIALPTALLFTPKGGKQESENTIELETPPPAYDAAVAS